MPSLLRFLSRRASRVLLLAGGTILACSSPVAPIGGVEAAARGGEIEITNATSKPVFTFVIGRNIAARALWGPCVDAAVCLPIQPGDRRRVAFPAGEREALVNWWHVVTAPDGTLRPDSIRTRIVQRED